MFIDAERQNDRPSDTSRDRLIESFLFRLDTGGRQPVSLDQVNGVATIQYSIQPDIALGHDGRSPGVCFTETRQLRSIRSITIEDG